MKVNESESINNSLISRTSRVGGIPASFGDSASHSGSSAQVYPRSRRIREAAIQGGDDLGRDPQRHSRREGEERRTSKAFKVPPEDREADSAASNAHRRRSVGGGGKGRVGDHILAANHSRKSHSKHDVRGQDETIRVDQGVEIHARFAEVRF